VEVGDFCDAEFIAHAREDVPWLVERVRELIGAICWDTTCLNCSSLLDSNYDQYMRAEKAEAEVERLTEAYQWTDQVLTAVTAERDALIAVGKRQAARLARVEAYVLDELRAALAGSEADTTDTQPTDQEDQS
jgi:hypothetical protein